MIIYSALNTLNGKRYIGQTKKSLQERRWGHLHTTRCPVFHKALKKYPTKFLWTILDTADSMVELNLKEQFWIHHYNTTDMKYGYNLTLGGKVGALPNEVTRKKLSNSLKGNKNGKGGHLGNKNRAGTKVSDETKAKLSAYFKGKAPWNKGLKKCTP